LRHQDGTPARISLPTPGGRMLHAQVWQADVGRVPLLLLDSNVPENDDLARGVTDRLYGGSNEDRLNKQPLLCTGGLKAQRSHSRLSGHPEPEVDHWHESHAGFFGVERIRELMQSQQLSFAAATEVVRAGTVFTTHTPVP